MNSVLNKLLLQKDKSQAQIKQLVLPFTGISSKKVEVNFQGGALSSDTGVLLLRKTEREIGILDLIANSITEDRDKRYVKQSIKDMLGQRVYQVACGREDGDDCDHLRDDPSFKMATGRLPQSDPSLASQPTISRFENSISNRELYRIAEAFVEKFIVSYPTPPKVIVLDFDETVDPVHGQQQLSLFNGYYKERCYTPLHIYEGLSGKFIASILKPGKRISGEQTLSILKRLVNKLRQAWGEKTILVFRGDSHFSSPLIHDWIEEQKNLYFVTGLSGNDILYEMCKDLKARAKKLYREKGQPVKLYHSFYYQAGSWSSAQRVIVKIECTESGVNTRFKEYPCPVSGQHLPSAKQFRMAPSPV